MQLLETIRFEKGEFSNLPFHQNRMNNSQKMLFDRIDEIDLVSTLKPHTADLPDNQLFKCRIVYDAEIRKIEFIPYKFPNISSLKLVNCDEIEYGHKYLDRGQINELSAQKGKADDIIIVKNGLITDSSFANLLFCNGEQWITPAFPLLKGTQRAMLLEQERIITADIRPSDLRHFKKVRLINAMLRFEDGVDVLVGEIR